MAADLRGLVQVSLQASTRLRRAPHSDAAHPLEQKEAHKGDDIASGAENKHVDVPCRGRLAS